MNNAELFRRVFGMDAEKFWCFSAEEMLGWLASEGSDEGVIIGKWVPMTEKDKLPPDGEEVIVSICDETGDTRYDYTSHGWLTPDKEYWVVDDEINNYVTAWINFPEPYKEKKDA